MWWLGSPCVLDGAQVCSWKGKPSSHTAEPARIADKCWMLPAMIPRCVHLFQLVIHVSIVLPVGWRLQREHYRKCLSCRHPYRHTEQVPVWKISQQPVPRASRSARVALTAALLQGGVWGIPGQPHSHPAAHRLACQGQRQLGTGGTVQCLVGVGCCRVQAPDVTPELFPVPLKEWFCPKANKCRFFPCLHAHIHV